MKLFVISLLLAFVYLPAFSQGDKVESFRLSDYDIELEKTAQHKDSTCYGEFLNILQVRNENKVLFEKKICSVELEDVQIVSKGYLTVVEHYSSPVGWSQYYIIDSCKGRLIQTKRLEEGTVLVWHEFIELSGKTKEMYVERVQGL